MVKLSQYKVLLTPASIFTVSFLGFFLLILTIGVLYSQGISISFNTALVMVIFINIFIWLVGPSVNEFFMKIIYDIEWVDFEEYSSRYPEHARVMENICDDNNIQTPKIGIIDDGTPFAMTFGSDHWNARVVYSKGLEKRLEKEEFDSVIAHELGHIRNRDFILMTIITTIIQLIAIVYIYTRVLGRKVRDGRAMMVVFSLAVIAYLVLIIGKYLQLYISRSREYKADSFSADYINSAALSSALVKISYGIYQKNKEEEYILDHEEEVGKEETSKCEKKNKFKKNVLNNMNIVSMKADQKEVSEFLDKGSKERAKYAMLYDAYSPWAKIAELHSTHPLTGNRIKALEKKSGTTIFNLESFAQKHKKGINKMKKVFLKDLKYLSLKYLGAITGIIITLLTILTPSQELISFDHFLIGVSSIFILAALGKFAEYRRRFPSEGPDEEKIGDLYKDLTASPVKGRQVKLQGKIIGRTPAGNNLSPDTALEDNTGFIPTFFASRLGKIGRLWKAIKNTSPHIDKKSQVIGWYYRKHSNNIIKQKYVKTQAGKWKSYPQFWFMIKIIILLSIGLIILGVDYYTQDLSQLL